MLASEYRNGLVVRFGSCLGSDGVDVEIIVGLTDQ